MQRPKSIALAHGSAGWWFSLGSAEQYFWSWLDPLPSLGVTWLWEEPLGHLGSTLYVSWPSACQPGIFSWHSRVWGVEAACITSINIPLAEAITWPNSEPRHGAVDAWWAELQKHLGKGWIQGRMLQSTRGGRWPQLCQVTGKPKRSSPSPARYWYINPERQKLVFLLDCSAEISSSHVPHCLLQQEKRAAFKEKQRQEWIHTERAIWWDVPSALTLCLPATPILNQSPRRSFSHLMYQVVLKDVDTGSSPPGFKSQLYH